MNISLAISLVFSLETGLLCAKHTLLAKQAYFPQGGNLSPSNAFRNMIKDGLLQSNRLVIDKPNLTERFMKRGLYNRINNGEDIEEIWLRYQDGEIKLLFKKTDGQQ